MPTCTIASALSESIVIVNGGCTLPGMVFGIRSGHMEMLHFFTDGVGFCCGNGNIYSGIIDKSGNCVIP